MEGGGGGTPLQAQAWRGARIQDGYRSTYAEPRVQAFFFRCEIPWSMALHKSQNLAHPPPLC